MLLKANWNNECHWNVQNYGPSQGLHGWQGPQGLGLAWILQNRKRRHRALLWYGGLACQKLAVAALHLQWALHHFSHENRVPKCGLMNCCDSQTTNISNLRILEWYQIRLETCRLFWNWRRITPMQRGGALVMGWAFLSSWLEKG